MILGTIAIVLAFGVIFFGAASIRLSEEKKSLEATIVRTESHSAGRIQNFEKQVNDLKESNTTLFKTLEEYKRVAVEAVKAKQDFMQKPILDEETAVKLAIEIAVRMPAPICHGMPDKNKIN